MATPRLHSAKRIEQQFHTGEEPVMVMCSDINIYVCKYMRSSAAAYKLACEFIGAKFATTCANLMYDVVHEQLVSIDYGCIFNTATFDAPFSQLTSTITQVWKNFMDCLNENIE